MKLIVACATNDGRDITSEHFGGARQYALYELNETTCTFLQSLPNTSEPEKRCADPEKARSVTELLTDQHVQVVVGKQFGPNIGRIKQHFVPVLIKTDTIEAGCAKVLEQKAAIVDELHNGESRSFLIVS